MDGILKLMAEDKNKVGRKWFDGKDEEKVIAECKYMWSLGAPDCDAAIYAEVSASSLSRYLDAHLEVKQIRDKLQEKPTILARETVIKNLGDNYQNAMDYLKRKKSKEFGDRQNLNISGELTMSDILKKLDDNGSTIKKQRLAAPEPVQDNE